MSCTKMENSPAIKAFWKNQFKMLFKKNKGSMWFFSTWLPDFMGFLDWVFLEVKVFLRIMLIIFIAASISIVCYLATLSS